MSAFPGILTASAADAAAADAAAAAAVLPTLMSGQLTYAQTHVISLVAQTLYTSRHFGVTTHMI